MGGVGVPLLIFAAVILGVWGLYSILMDVFLRDQTRLSDRINEEFRAKQRERAKKTSLFKDLGKMASEAAENEPGMRERLENLIEQSGSDDMTVEKVLAGAAIFGAAFAAVGFAFHSLIGPLVGFCIGAYVPIMVLKVKKSQRISKLREQLPDTFDLMARVIRAGQTMSQAMQAVTDEMPPPVAIEFALCYEQMNLGIPPEAALRDLARRTGILELQIFVMALLIQRQTGGNLAEMLDNISTVVRERFRIIGQIKTLTAEGRLQAAVLLALPPGMFVMMLILNPNYAKDLVNRPILIVAMLISEGIGALWIRKIVNFDF